MTETSRLSAVSDDDRSGRPTEDDAFSAFCTAGLWPGLPRAAADRLAQAGLRGPNDVTAERMAAVEGVGPARATKLVDAFTRVRPVYEVCEVLVAAGAPARLALAVVDALGESSAAALTEDPWRILAVAGVSPGQADSFARRVLGDEARPHDRRRGRALVSWLLARAARDGHTAQPESTVRSALGGFGVGDAQVAVQAALDDGAVLRVEAADLVAAADEAPAGSGPPTSAEPEQVRELLAATRLGTAEDAIAEGLTRLAATAEPLCEPEGVAAVVDGLDDAQGAAVAAAAAHGVSVLTGGPGTGKSRTVAAVVELAGQLGAQVALAAPTGRAARRLAELTGTEATTLHRLLGALGPAGGFARGENWPLDADVVVVDEVSMLDVELAAALVEALADGTHLLLVGDPAQLPSIGPGRVLADVIASGLVPVAELRTLYRQAEGGAIARLASAVRDGALPPVDSPDLEVVVVAAEDGTVAAHRVVQLVTDSIPRALGISAAEVQVVTPIHRGASGTLALNTALKTVLNPGDGEHWGFDLGDRVVTTANHPEVGFANGEVGVVSAAEQRGLVVAFASGPVTVPPRVLADVRLGWAITVHRAQGSEWPAVVAVVPGEAAGMLSRPLVYTAFTRAQRHLSVVHSAGRALPRAVAQVGERPRRTRLRSLLRDG